MSDQVLRPFQLSFLFFFLMRGRRLDLISSGLLSFRWALAFGSLLPAILLAQVPEPVYHDARNFDVGGRAFDMEQEPFIRIPAEQAAVLSERLRQLAQNTAGFYLDFQSNATSLHLQWELDEYRTLWNMTPLAVNGFDLYARTANGWQYMASAKPSGNRNSVKIIGNLDGKLHSYRLHFPLYSGLRDLKLGVSEGAVIHSVSEVYPATPRLLIYGSSITQGASASRPGMAFPAIIGRELGVEVFNFGFSGSGKMEMEMAEILGTIPTDLIVLDCVANPSPEEIRERSLPFIQRLRSLQPHTPILMVESIFRENGHWDRKTRQRVMEQNAAFREAWEQLQELGLRELYYLSNENLIGMDHEATTDGVHLSDLGHYRMAGELGRTIKKILEGAETNQNIKIKTE